jgi:hypothetical protein
MPSCGLAWVRTSVYHPRDLSPDNSHQVEWSGKVSVIVCFQGRNNKNTIHDESFPECQEASQRTSGFLKTRMSGIPDLLLCDVCRIPEDKNVRNT